MRLRGAKLVNKNTYLRTHQSPYPRPQDLCRSQDGRDDRDTWQSTISYPAETRMNRGSRLFSSVVSKSEPVNGLEVLGIDQEGPVEIVEGLQAIALFKLSPSLPNMAPGFLRAMGFLGLKASACMVCSLDLCKSPAFWQKWEEVCLNEYETFEDALERSTTRKGCIRLWATSPQNNSRWMLL